MLCVIGQHGRLHFLRLITAEWSRASQRLAQLQVVGAPLAVSTQLPCASEGEKSERRPTLASACSSFEASRAMGDSVRMRRRGATAPPLI